MIKSIITLLLVAITGTSQPDGMKGITNKIHRTMRLALGEFFTEETESRSRPYLEAIAISKAYLGTAVARFDKAHNFDSLHILESYEQQNHQLAGLIWENNNHFMEFRPATIGTVYREYSWSNLPMEWRTALDALDGYWYKGGSLTDGSQVASGAPQGRYYMYASWNCARGKYGYYSVPFYLP